MRELVIVWMVLAWVAVPASGQERLIVTERAAVILNPVKPDSTAEFEVGLAQLRAALEAASDPIKKQQAQGFKLYRSSEPVGPNVLYVFILDPAVPFADYSFKRLLDSLPANEAEAALKRLAGSLADTQRVFSMELHAVPPPRKPEPAKKKK
jgi:hypothetical protein